MSRYNFTFEELNNAFEYNEHTGQVYWKVSRGSAKVGDLANSTQTLGYKRVNYKGISILQHHLVWFLKHKYWPGRIDHKNRISSINTINNLRECTIAQNAMNKVMKRGSKSGYRGVYWVESRKKYAATIKIKNRTVSLGRFDTAEHAAVVRLAAEFELFGEFALDA